MHKNMNYYQVHGLGIASEIYFPELNTKKKDIDVIIRFGKIDSSSGNFSDFYLGEMTKARVFSKNIQIIWNNILICNILDSKEIVVNPKTGLKKSFLRLIILSYAIAIILHKRGRLVLHANAVNIRGNAVVFLGNRGQGKSTTSFIMHKNGYELLCDDILSIDINKGDFPIVYSGYPRIKLLPKVLINSNEDLELSSRVSFNSEKRSYCVSDNFYDVNLPLKTIYLIEKNNENEIEKLNLQKALIELIKSSYCYRLFNDFELNENLKMCSEIVKKVPIKSFYIKQSLDDLPELVKIMEKDLLINI